MVDRDSDCATVAVGSPGTTVSESGDGSSVVRTVTVVVSPVRRPVLSGVCSTDSVRRIRSRSR
ncbi:hypothetical protein D8S78_20890 [Natrialba swarupiae]|nr:hypothetical protein [Natrialba swarupiae]